MRSSYFASDKMGGNGGLWKSLVDTPTPTPVMRLMSDSNGSTLGGGGGRLGGRSKCGLTPTNTRATKVEEGIQSYYLLHLGELNLWKLSLSELVSDLGNHDVIT